MFVYPSMYEGFGLPVVEAMACGVPVITGQTAALSEIGGGAIMTVDRIDSDTLGRALVELAESRDRREELSGRGLARAASFSWQRAARESLDIYRETADARSRALSRSKPGASPAADGRNAPAVPASATGLKSWAGAPSEAAQPFRPGTSSIDVLFGQAYFLRFDPKLWEARQPYAPLGALYAAACVREHGYRVALFDAMLAASESEWAVALDRHRPRFAVIYEDNFNYLSKMCLLRMRQAALTMIDAARARGITVVVAGADATDHPVTYLDRGAAAVVTGEGEVTLVELLNALSHSIALKTVEGLCLRDEDGRVVQTNARAIIRQLDSLPFPAWDLVDVERYRATWRSHHGYFSMNLVTTRGCPYHCNWCAKPIYGQRYTARSPEHVVEEMAWLKRTFRPDHLWIADDIFGLKPGWIERFAELLQARDAATAFKCLLRADQVTVDVARALKAAGCQTAWIGAESGSQRILDAMEKGTRVDQIVSATRLLHHAGIEVGFFLQFGYPGETRDDIEQTLRMVRSCGPDDIGVSVSYPLPGTGFYERVKSQLGEKQNWLDSDDLAMMYRATYSPAFYRALYARVHSEFRIRKGVRGLGQAALRPWTIGRRHLHDATRLAAHALKLPALRWRMARE
jgi:anaerobic magnesium-protoporphyrin IX monomethyl ester cyclase